MSLNTDLFVKIGNIQKNKDSSVVKHDKNCNRVGSHDWFTKVDQSQKISNIVKMIFKKNTVMTFQKEKKVGRHV